MKMIAISAAPLALMLAGCGSSDDAMGSCDMAAMSEQMMDKMSELAEAGDQEAVAELNAKAAEIREKTVAGLEDQSYSPEELCADYEAILQIGE